MTTIRDVAKLAGVGVGTASRALTGSAGVADATRHAVQEAARKLNFRPSSTARALSNRQSGTIGLLTPRFYGPYYGEAVTVAERVIRRAGKHVIVTSSFDLDDERWTDAEGLDFLSDRDCDGILIFDSNLPERDLVLFAEKTPSLAFVNRRLSTLPEMCFSVDHRAAGRSIADYLVSQNHRTFAVISGPSWAEDARLRHQGFCEGLADAGIPLDPRLVVEGNYQFAGGPAAAAALLATGLSFSALFCGNDEMAVTAKAHLAGAGCKPVVFGYDNINLLSYFEQKISSVAVPVAEMVANACAFVLNRSYGGDRPVVNHFETKLVLRN